MSTKRDDRLAAGDRAKQSMKGQAEALRDHEAAARAAAREAHEARTQSVVAHTAAAAAKLDELDDAADAKLGQLETRLESAEHALSAELADDRQAFADAIKKR